MIKTDTDRHWQRRAQSVQADRDVNIQDVYQRELEYDFICPHLKSDMQVLEVGCGNGYSTNVFRDLVQRIDCCDQSESMIERAKQTYGERNNRFFVDDIRAPLNVAGPYDAVICVRVLINLANLDDQLTTVNVLKDLVKPEGLLILVEGFKDGFENLNVVRRRMALPDLQPAKINYYSHVCDVMPALEAEFTILEEYHLGNYDYLTRVVYPALVGPDQVTHNTPMHEKLSHVAKAYTSPALKDLSRIRGWILRKSLRVD